MIQLHFGTKYLKIGKTMGDIRSFVWNHAKYANLEGFHRDSYKYVAIHGSMIQIRYVLYWLKCSTCIIQHIHVHGLYSTKLLRDKAFTVRQPHKYSWKILLLRQNDIHKFQNSWKLAGKHSQFKQKPWKLRKFWPSNVLY